MNSFTELFSVETEKTEKFPEGLTIYAYKYYHGYSDETDYGVSVMDNATLDDIDDEETSFEKLEQTFNGMMKKYGVNRASWLYI